MEDGGGKVLFEGTAEGLLKGSEMMQRPLSQHTEHSVQLSLELCVPVCAHAC